MNSGKMTPARKSFNADVTRHVPKVTLVIQVPEEDVEQLRLLLDACRDGVPAKLAEFMDNARRQLG